MFGLAAGFQGAGDDELRRRIFVFGFSENGIDLSSVIRSSELSADDDLEGAERGFFFEHDASFNQAAS